MVHDRVEDIAGDEGSPTPTMAIDPVCGMRVERALAVGTEELDGQLYFFCSASCQQTFRANPRHYVSPSDEATR